MTADNPTPNRADASLLERSERSAGWNRRRLRGVLLISILWLMGAGCAAVIVRRWQVQGSAAAALPSAAPARSRSACLPHAETLANRTGFLGQFSAVDTVEIRAQVGGVLTEIGFKDGQVVKRGDLLFIIDPRPYEIKLAAAAAAVRTAEAQSTLAQAELWRAQQLKQTSFGTAENVDQRAAESRVASAAVDTATSNVRNATLDLEYSRVTAPFTGRVSNHRVSVGSLVSGSRAGTSPTTLLTSIVSLDPIYLDFDMSENDYLAFARAHPDGVLGEEVDFRLSDETKPARHGTLDFIDNAIDRSSGTIHARAICPNPDGFLKPGSFARVSLVTEETRPTRRVTQTALQLDQANHVVMTVDANDTVIPKVVTVGDLYDGLRAITGGLLETDPVVVDGLSRAIPGQKVTPHMRAASGKGSAG